MKFDIRDFFFRKSVQKIKVLLKSDKNNGRFTRPMYLPQFFLTWDVSDKSCRENQNTHCTLNKLFRTCCLWGNVEKYGKARQTTDDNMIIWHMRPSCWTTNSTDNTQWQYVIRTYCFSTTTMATERAAMLRLYVLFVLRTTQPVSLQPLTAKDPRSNPGQSIQDLLWTK